MGCVRAPDPLAGPLPRPATDGPSLLAAELRRHVIHLAVTLMPRNADGPSNLDAASYIREEFARAGCRGRSTISTGGGSVAGPKPGGDAFDTKLAG